jgi:hypothetical protein
VENGLGYSGIAAATAEVAGESFFDLGHTRRWHTIQQGSSSHHEPRRAESALQGGAIAGLALLGKGLDDAVVSR